MIVYLLALASVCGFEFYLTLCTKIDGDNYKVLSRPDSDEVEVAVTSRRQNSGDVRKVSTVTWNKYYKRLDENIMTCHGRFF